VEFPNTTIWPLTAVNLGQTWPRWFLGGFEGSEANETQKAVASNQSAHALFSHNLHRDKLVCEEDGLTLHGVTCLPLEFGRVAAEVGVCAEDEGNVGCTLVSNDSSPNPTREVHREEERKGYKQLCMPPSQYRGVILVKLPEYR
jgi:hypothetical protein